jgi:hypothetical protein
MVRESFPRKPLAIKGESKTEDLGADGSLLSANEA